MGIPTTYQFEHEDIHEVIKFCRDYHLDLTKQATGRTGSGPRGLGGEIDAFGPGKLNEIGISKLISIYEEKLCKVDNKIYSNYEVGTETIPDIVEVLDNKGKSRKPNLYIEIKKISDSDHWLGIHSEQLESILKNPKITNTDIYLIYGEVFFDDNKNKKEQDFLGAFLNEIGGSDQIKFDTFSKLTDLKCKIHYVLSINDLKKYGHEFLSGDIIPEFNIKPAKQVFRSDGSLWKGLKVQQTLKGKNRINAIEVNGKKHKYGDFLVHGDVELISASSTNRQYLHFLTNGSIENEYFGTLNFRKNETIFFNLTNMLAGNQGTKTKTKDDWWISRIKLEQLIQNGKIDKTNEAMRLIQQKI
jgi:hypothetical protein